MRDTCNAREVYICMKKVMILSIVLFFGADSKVAIGQETSTSSNSETQLIEEIQTKDSEQKAESEILSIEETQEKFENQIEKQSKDSRGLKGKQVAGISGLFYKEDVYKVSLTEGSTLDLNRRYYDDEKTATIDPQATSANRIFVNTSAYTFEWVKPNGSPYPNPTYTNPHIYSGELKEGFNKAHIKVRGNAISDKVIEIPVFVESQNFRIINDKYAVKIIKKTDKGESFPYFSGKDIRRETKQAINEKLEEELEFELYDVQTQQLIPQQEINVSFIESSVEGEYARGLRDITFQVGNEEMTMNNSLLLISDEIINEFGNLEEWESVSYNDSSGVVTNPVNNSRIAMPNRGIHGRNNQINGYLIRDKFDFGMGYERGWEWGANPPPRKPEIRTRTQISANFGIKEVGEKGTGSLYKAAGSNTSDWGVGNDFSSWPQYTTLTEDPYGPLIPVVDYHVTGKYFLKKDRELLQIQVDPNPEVDVTYVLSNGLSRNLNFSTRNYMYNNRLGTREFASVSGIDTDYYQDGVPIYSLGNHQGFKLSAPKVSANNYEKMELSVKLKDNNGNWLTDVTRYQVGGVGATTSNPFGKDFEKKSQETDSYYEKAGVSLTSASDTAFSLGAPWKKVSYDEKLTAGYDVFLGQEINYMDLKLNPKEKNIYQDQFDDKIATNFTVGKLTNGMYTVKEGDFEVSYPDGYTDKIRAKTLNNTNIVGKYQFDKAHFPSEINNIPGTKVTYPIKTIFVNQSNDAINELPSNEAFYNLNVYNLGATGDLQRIKKGSSFNKKAKDLISNPVYLPGHDSYISYIYMLDGQEITKDNPTLKELGIDEDNDKMQYMTIKMTDRHPNENNRSSLIQVPVLVSDDITSKGVLAYGEDFKIEPVDMTKWTDKEIDEFFIKNSKATGFNLDTNPAERIPVELDRTNVPFNLKAKEEYKFKIIATSPTNTALQDIKEVTITIASKIEATANPQEIQLGKKTSELDLKDFVKDVKASGEDIDKSKYEVSLLSEIPDVITEKSSPFSLPVEVRLTGEPVGTGERIEVPVSIVWGNSVVFGGDEKDGRMGGGAYTLHGGQNPYIAAASGLKKSNDTLPIHSGIAKQYLKLGWYDLENSNSVYSISKKIDDVQSTQPNFEVSALGVDNKQSILDEWGTRNVNYGDIVRGWSVEPGKQYVSRDEKLVAYNDKQDEIYYEIIKNNKNQAEYRRMQFNQIIVKEQEIQYNITKEELKTNVENYLKFKDLEGNEQRKAKIIGFKDGEYPIVTKPGDKSSGTIVVEETLATNNKKIHYEVEVPFVAVDGGLSFVSADNLEFGSKLLPDKDVYFAPVTKSNQVVIDDSRYRSQENNAPEVKGWVLKAKLESGLHFGEGANRKELEGSAIMKYHEKADITLNEHPQEVFVKQTAKFGKNVVEWDNEINEGYRLYVKAGTAEKNVDYKATMIYSIDDGPIIRGLD